MVFLYFLSVQQSWLKLQGLGEHTVKEVAAVMSGLELLSHKEP